MKPVCREYDIPRNGCPCRFEQAIFILRNPFDAILAEFKREAAISQTGIEDGSHTAEFSKIQIENGTVGKSDWPTFTKKWLNNSFGSMSWILLVEEWVSNFRKLNRGQVHLVCFDKLVKNPGREVGKMMDFLKIHSSRREHRKKCFRDSLEGSFHRKKLFESWEVYDDAMRTEVMKTILKAKSILLENGFEDCTQYFDVPNGFWKLVG